MDKNESTVKIVQCANTGNDQMVELNSGRTPCLPNQPPLLKWCSQIEDEAPACGECLKPESH